MTSQPSDNVKLVTSGPAFDAVGLVYRVRLPADFEPGKTYPTLVMTHGLQGNENVTWIFARPAGPKWLILTPRAPFADQDGYSWYKVATDAYGISQIEGDSYQAGEAAFRRFIEAIPSVYPADRSHLVLLGFSQGAAMSYGFGASHPVTGIAALGGFLPKPLLGQPAGLAGLKGVPILILHGTEDETIHIRRARKDRDRLVEAGAVVSYHESKVGHKVSAAGMHELARWLSQRLT